MKPLLKVLFISTLLASNSLNAQQIICHNLEEKNPFRAIFLEEVEVFYRYELPSLFPTFPYIICCVVLEESIENPPHLIALDPAWEIIQKKTPVITYEVKEETMIKPKEEEVLLDSYSILIT